MDDTKEGTGVLTTNHGDRYIGSFKCDAYHGDGTLTWAAGDEYIGSWANGKMNGYGMYKWYVSSSCWKYGVADYLHAFFLLLGKMVMFIVVCGETT